jgi:predicted cupin superfamily sugar epimerase
VKLSAQDLVGLLGLERNPEGGFYRQYYTSPVAAEGDRPAVTVIYYLITSRDPIGYLHRMAADSVHFFHLGSPLRVHLVDPEGRLESSILGPDPSAGQLLQLVVGGGVWKAFELPEGEFALMSEAVTPGWIPSDQESATPDLVSRRFPHLKGRIERFIKIDGGKGIEP